MPARALSALALLLAAGVAAADDWPGWRGPRADGTVADKGYPFTWSAADNVKWKIGRVPCLEGVVTANLARLSRLLRILGYYAHDLNLKPSWTAYMRYGKGPKQRLRFSKTGDPRLEKAYATHFIWPGKAPFLALRTPTMQRAPEV